MPAAAQLIECVPNISEGRDRNKIETIARVVETVDGVKLLNIDAGMSANRTVITFVGPPEAVTEAAFRLIKKAAELIDMRKQLGEHPRMGATDVCPLIPIRGIEMGEVVEYAHRLGERVGRELGIPGYFYENSCRLDLRRNLEYCRQGEYEGLDKLATPEGKPDFGPAEFNDSVRKTGATAISARDFLIAYNINLNTTSARLATAIAMDIRESGRAKREGNPETGKIVTEGAGRPVRIPGSLKHVKGIGWYIEEYGIAQLSLNLTNIDETPMHVAFDEACKKAETRGMRVTGSEIVGLVPLRCLIEAADYYLTKQRRSLGIPESEKIKISLKSLGLDDLSPFDPQQKVIEYLMADKGKRLIDESLEKFADRVGSDAVMPGGGCASAYCGALAASLAGMVANISGHKRGWEHRWEEFSDWAVEAERLKALLLVAVDEDMEAYNRLVAAFGHSKVGETAQSLRKKAVSEATRYAAEVPLRIARLADETFPVLRKMAEIGTPTAVADAAVGAMCARTAVRGAALNARHNVTDFDDRDFAKETLAEIEGLESKADSEEESIRRIAMERMNG